MMNSLPDAKLRTKRGLKGEGLSCSRLAGLVVSGREFVAV